GREWMDQKPALGAIGRRDQARDRIEHLFRLLFVPGHLARSQLFQAEEIVGASMANDARRMPCAFLHENRFDLGLEEFIVETLSGWCSGLGSLDCASRHAGRKTRDYGGDHNKTNRHPYLPLCKQPALTLK